MLLEPTEFLKGQDMLVLGVIYKVDTPLMESPEENSRTLAKLQFNTRVFIHKELKYGWYFVVTDDGLAGYISAFTVKKAPPEPLSKIHKIMAGESAIGIAEQYYKKSAQNWGADLRFYINAIVYANDGEGNPGKGIYRNIGKDWKDAKTRAGYFIWIPSVEFVNKLKGVLSSGSITYQMWNSIVKGADVVWEFAKSNAAFIAGLLHGFLESIWDTLTGFFNLLITLTKILWSILTLNILSDVKELFNKLINLPYREIIENWVENFETRWNHEDGLKKWHFRGWVIGYATAEIVMMFVSFGTITGLKWTSKMSKMSKIIKEWEPIKKLLSATAKVKNKIPPAITSVPLILRRVRLTMEEMWIFEKQGGHTLSNHGPFHTTKTLLSRIVGESKEGSKLQAPKMLKGGTKGIDFRIWIEKGKAKLVNNASKWADTETMIEAINNIVKKHIQEITEATLAGQKWSRKGVEIHGLSKSLGVAWIEIEVGGVKTLMWIEDLRFVDIFIEPLQDASGKYISWFLKTAYPVPVPGITP